MFLLGFIQHFLALLATRLYFTAGNSSPYFAVILVWPVTIHFLFQRGNSLKAKLRHILKLRFQHCDSYIRKETSKLNFKILNSVFMDDTSYRYREWANPVAYVCTETSRSGSESTDESESNSDEGSNQDENEDSVEKGTKMVETVTDDSVTCISSTKPVFESLTASEIPRTQKRKAESEKLENPKKSKSGDSLKILETSNKTEKITDVNIKTPSEISSCYDNQETSSVSDPKLTHVLDESPECDRTDVELSEIEIQSIEKSEDIRFPSQVSSPSRDKKSGVEDLHRNNSNDKSVTSSGSEMFTSRDSASKNNVPVCQTERKATELTRTETNKSYPNPKKPWKNLMQDEPRNTPSDPRMVENYMSMSEYRLGRWSRLRKNPSYRITQDTLTQQNMASDNNTETSDAEKHLKSSTDSSKNVTKDPYILPEINVSDMLLIEHCKQLMNLESLCFDASKYISEIDCELFENFRSENIKETVQTSSGNVSLECPSFSREREENSESRDTNSTSLECPEISSNTLPCSSTGKSRSSKKITYQWRPAPSPDSDYELDEEDEVTSVKRDPTEPDSYPKVYPELASEPLNVKKDARYQKRFFKNPKGIALPKDYTKTIQLEANKPRDEVTIPTSDVPPSDGTDLPTDEHHDERQAVAQILINFDRAKENRIFSQAPPVTLNIRHLSDEENVCEEASASSDSGISRDSPVQSVLIKFTARREVVNPNDARTFCNTGWNLRKIDFGENKAPRARSGELSCENIPTQVEDIGTESKMEECPADAYQSYATSAENVEKKRTGQKSNDSSMDTLPVLSRYHSLKFISINLVTRIPEIRQRTVSYSGSEQNTSPGRKTPSESSKKSEPLSVELKDPPQETQTACDVSNVCQENPAACTHERLAGKQSQTENPTCCTETDFNKCITVKEDLEPFESNPIIVSSGEQESPGGVAITAEKSVNKESSSSSSAVEENTESFQQTYDIVYKLRSTPEKGNLSETDVLEMSSDSDDHEDSLEKEQSK